jgi:hypothetical protein
MKKNILFSLSALIALFFVTVAFVNQPDMDLGSDIRVEIGCPFNAKTMVKVGDQVHPIRKGLNSFKGKKGDKVILKILNSYFLLGELRGLGSEVYSLEDLCKGKTPGLCMKNLNRVTGYNF